MEINNQRPAAKINVKPMNGEVAVYTFFDVVPNYSDEKKEEVKGYSRKRIAYAIITISRIEKKNGLTLPGGAVQTLVVAQIQHIWTEKERRREKCATSIIGAIKQHADVIYAEPLTPDGKKLIESCGFVRADNVDMYRWKK